MKKRKNLSNISKVEIYPETSNLHELEIKPAASDSSRTKTKFKEIQKKSDSKAEPPKVSSEKELQILVESQKEVNDGRVLFQGSEKYNGWKKVEFYLDQQIPVCKAYYETGYCSFGDACRFLHTRDKIEASSTIDKENEIKAFKAIMEKNKKIGEMNAPEVCPICSKIYIRPIITICHHKFCQKCALDRYEHDPSCAVCGKDTMGIFNLYQDSHFSSNK